MEKEYGMRDWHENHSSSQSTRKLWLYSVTFGSASNSAEHPIVLAWICHLERSQWISWLRPYSQEGLVLSICLILITFEFMLPSIKKGLAHNSMLFWPGLASKLRLWLDVNVDYKVGSVFGSLPSHFVPFLSFLLYITTSLLFLWFFFFFFCLSIA